MDTLALRPATNADIEFCFDLHRSSFYQYVTEIWGWDEKDQRAIHIRDFKLGRVQIVTANPDFSCGLAVSGGGGAGRLVGLLVAGGYASRPVSLRWAGFPRAGGSFVS